MKGVERASISSLACTWALQSSLRSSATVCKNNIRSQAWTAAQIGRCPWGNGVSNSELAKSVKPGKVYLMRRKNVLSRFATRSRYRCLSAACRAGADALNSKRERRAFSGYAVMASPRDMHAITAPIRLSDADRDSQPRHPLRRRQCRPRHPDLEVRARQARVLSQCVGVAHQRLRLRGLYGSMISLAPLLVDQLTAMGFDASRSAAALYVTGADGSWETISEIQAELTGRRKGRLRSRQLYDPRPTARVRCNTRSRHREAQSPRWPTKLTLKGDLLEASFEGHLDVGESLQLSGQAELSTPSVRRGARWFGVPVPSSEVSTPRPSKGRSTGPATPWRSRTPE